MAEIEPSSAVGVRVQVLPGIDQALVLAALAQTRSGDGRFSPNDLAAYYDDIGLPRPSHLSNLLAALARRQFAGRARGHRGRWKLSPTGGDRAGRLLTTDQMLALARESAQDSGAMLGGRTHPTLAPWLAPPDIEPAVAAFLNEHPFSRNVFVMTRYPTINTDRTPDPVQIAIESTQEACRAHGLDPLLASEHGIVDDVWGNVTAHMWASKYGIAIFEDRLGLGLNDNLTIEVGGMLITGRRCALLRDGSIAAMPTDLVGHIYKRVDISNGSAVAAAVHTWIRDDLLLGPCGSACGKVT